MHVMLCGLEWQICLSPAFCFDQLMAPQKGEKKKKKKKVSNTDTLQEQRKNKKEMEFELKLAKEKEEMYEREKQLKINRLVQEVRKEGFTKVNSQVNLTINEYISDVL